MAFLRRKAIERLQILGRIHAPRITFLRFTYHVLRLTLPPCSKPSESSSTPPQRSSRISGGFFDVPSVQARLSALEVQAGAANFWDNNEQARKVLDEQATLRRRIEPLFDAEKRLEDFRVMIELCEAEPEAAQLKHQTELEAEGAAFLKSIGALELAVLLSGPHDRR